MFKYNILNLSSCCCWELACWLAGWLADREASGSSTNSFTQCRRSRQIKSKYQRDAYKNELLNNALTYYVSEPQDMKWPYKYNK